MSVPSSTCSLKIQEQSRKRGGCIKALRSKGQEGSEWQTAFWIWLNHHTHELKAAGHDLHKIKPINTLAWWEGCGAPPLTEALLTANGFFPPGSAFLEGFTPAMLTTLHWGGPTFVELQAAQTRLDGFKRSGMGGGDPGKFKRRSGVDMIKTHCRKS